MNERNWGDGPIWYTGIGCSGEENSFDDCYKVIGTGSGISGCSHTEDVSIMCVKQDIF